MCVCVHNCTCSRPDPEGAQEVCQILGGHGHGRADGHGDALLRPQPGFISGEHHGARQVGSPSGEARARAPSRGAQGGMGAPKQLQRRRARASRGRNAAFNGEW